MILRTLCALSLALTSCVSYQTYEKALADRDEYRARATAQADSLDRLTDDARRNREAGLSLEERYRLANDELRSLSRQYDQLDRANEDLLARYDRVLAQNQAELTASSGQLTKLQTELGEKEQELLRRERDANEARAALDEREAELNRRIALLESDLTDTRSTADAKSREADQLRAALAEKDARINALRDRVRDALTGFAASDLSVEERGGQVYVSLSQRLLFPSGSREVNDSGRDALRKVAGVLAGSQDIAIVVEGHTDSDGSAAANWELSTGRATAVAQALISGGVAPERITAAGRGEHHPVADNATEDGKARNRRTEIILTPKLGELYQLVVGSE